MSSNRGRDIQGGRSVVFDKEEIDRIRRMQSDWEGTTLKQELQESGEWKTEFKSLSGIPIKRVYTPLDLVERGWSYSEKLGFPGQYPMTRGRTATAYRGSIWPMWVYGGFGTAEDANKRYKYLVEQGTDEVAVALDLPTQLGYDSDNPLCKGEVGKIGVAIDTLADVEDAFKGLPLEEILIFTTANAIGPIFFAFVVAMGKQRGVPIERMHINIQNEILKEYVARGTYIFPPKPSVKFSVDLIEHVCQNNLSDHVYPYWFCGYHMKESGATAIQEMAFTMANTVTYLDELVSRGVDINTFHDPMVNLATGIDFFEAICEQRAFRRWWAKLMKERYGASNPRTLGVYLKGGSNSSNYTAQQPLNNIVRGALSILAQALSGEQTMGTGAMDEALGIPTEESHRLALRTQQIIAYESGIINTVDPLAGSYFVEALTDELEKRAIELFNKVQEMGGAIKAIESGFMQSQIMQSAYQFLKEMESGERIVVGVNKFQVDEPTSVRAMKIDETVEKRQIERLNKVRKGRDDAEVNKRLKELKEAAIEGVNLVQPCMAAVKAYATIGEMCGVLRELWGEYRVPAF
jgi:methylmalonyl-CoA mutase N-terminal domain/subunit